MKKLLKNLFLLLTVTTMSFAFSSCGDDDEPANPTGDSSIIGTWVSVNTTTVNGYAGYLEITFNSNKTGTVTAVYDKYDPESYNFEYTLRTDSDNDIRIDIIPTSTKYFYKGTYYLTVTPSKLVIGGDTYTRK